MKLDEIVNEIITAAYSEAKFDMHKYFTPEHILYASLFYNDGINIIKNTGGSVEGLKKQLEKYFMKNVEKLESGDPTQTVGVENIINQAANHVLTSGKDYVTIGDIYVAIYDDNASFGSYYLKQQGITRLKLLNYITHGISAVNDSDEDDIEPLPENEYLFDDYHEDEVCAIDKYTEDITEKAKNGLIDPLIGREDILKKTLQVLCRRRKNNPIHVGEPGVGKTAITEGLATLIAEDKVPTVLKGSKIYTLNMGTMVAGTKYRGDFEERIKNVLNEISKCEKPIVYIDEIHTIIGAGAVSGGTVDAANILKPYFTDGKIKFIGSTTYDEYKKIFDKDRALSRRFQKIDVGEPTINETYDILMGIKTRYEQFHNVHYTNASLKAAAALSAKCINDRFLPDKAIDVIDECGAFAEMNRKDTEKVYINVKDVENVISSISGIPVKDLSKTQIEKLKNLKKNLKSKIFGQDKALESIVQSIKRSSAGFNDENKPVASFLFVGPTGVGKTEISKQLAEALNIKLIRFDMSEYQEKHTVARLIGSPPGYVGYEEGGLLTDAVRKNPYCILLLDEIEKAHSDILNVLLQVMDYATLTDNSGKKADFRNIILIMTSNAGASEVGKNKVGFGNRVVGEDNIDKEVSKIFSPEFRNRLDDIIIFNKMDEDMAIRVAKRSLDEFQQKLNKKHIKIKVTDECYKWIASKGLNSNYGAREILRVIQEKIKPYFIDEVLFGNLTKGGETLIDVKDNNIKFESIDK
ncbi:MULTISPECIES: ATP-dependent Clp protease ATP-binding subunit ClpA [Clostridium]|uniref:ATP-dependent Clp proteinase n=1 Tax=Clostridium acetobutylicum (strain ATCC 824 / DSM 792 / JCM 1419 / IAM 19013 / LMG 5710 / NBRC 13948 / NRRL B-527 / VKM B-1787 / 2291 / W) TaxID=272562 RepID=Q97I30_CLOAB|nr:MULTISPECIES: ATP-dependent Clp protease ATP-binding subunit ClpA [Clostridium]AAK79789.1 ATP-dependent Clp proteinase [Clostridium acetobutylicum ATCC 824]ADZ20874.1 ATP-dependent Clp proteinase [Clostridium acetobutylicum EA 2018]AEI33681.1 ATP-dependent Clp proteinase [Clostridium acetobutylicum DSM 1731]AWV79776.1 ATP-dependent Clp protease ATP-binding subunit ClpA [Clostridium acetobutylicum]MBC2394242.1 ATP-dependent Clp protease ATP-binding subunit ClpA [Clostridium acetobutylicum]